MARFWIGTSGWHYEHWRGPFYPEELPKSRWLAYYMERFPTVELNNSFYHQPKEKTWDDWREAAPEGFRFAVKANRFITHIKRLKGCEEPLSRFLKGAERLHEHLGPILYQMPPNFLRTGENTARLEEFLTMLPPNRQHVIEFRHGSWFGKETMDLLRRHGIAFCSFDMVGMDCPLTATTSFAYMRFHGSEALYASNYTDQMLAKWARQLRGLAEGLEEIWIYFNNDAYGFAVANARRLAEMLGAPLPGP